MTNGPGASFGERISFPTNGAWKTESTYVYILKKANLDPYLSYTNIKSMCIEDLTARCETTIIKRKKNKQRETYEDSDVDNGFLAATAFVSTSSNSKSRQIELLQHTSKLQLRKNKNSRDMQKSERKYWQAAYK